MNTLRDILKQAQRELYCNTCKRSFAIEEIRFKGQLGDTIFLQTICMNDHPATVMVIMANFEGNLIIEPIDHDNLLEFYNKFSKFNGNLKEVIK